MARVRTLVEYLDFRLGTHSGSGPEFRWPCPACIDRIGSEASGPKLNVNTARSLGNCYRCGFKFNRFETLFRLLNDGMLRLEELRILKREVRLPSNNAVSAVKQAMQKASAKPAPLQPVLLPADVLDLTTDPKNPLARHAIKYLAGRGVGPELIERHQIGYCTSGRYAGYLTFPVKQNGKQVYFTTRYAGKAVDGRKSNNPPKAEGFHAKSTCLLNYDGAIGQPLVAIVEGPFDMMAWGGNAVALMGKSISDEQVALIAELCEMGTREIVVSLDSDAGKFAQMIYSRLLGRVPKVSVMLIPDGDPWDNRERLSELASSRGVPSSTALVRARYRAGSLVRRSARSYALRA